MRWLVLSISLIWAACRVPQREATAPARRGAQPPPPPAARQPEVSNPAVAERDTLERRAARLELRVLEREAEIAELQLHLDDARREVVRAMAKLQSLATRAEAASGMAEAEIALQALRGAEAADGPAAMDIAQAGRLLDLAVAEFDRQNYAGALYLASQAKSAAAAGQGRLAAGERLLRPGEVPFAVPLRVQTTDRANLRDGPGAAFAIVATLEAGVPLTAHSYVDQWVRVSDEQDRGGWVFQGLIGRRR